MSGRKEGGWVPNLPLDQLPSDTTQTRHVPSRLILGISFMALILSIDVAHSSKTEVRLPNLTSPIVERKLNFVLETPYIFGDRG